MNQRLSAVPVLLSGVMLSLALPLRAEPLPLWEAGTGVASFKALNRRSAHENSEHLWPIAYITHRGNILQADRDGFNALLRQTGNVRLSVGLNTEFALPDAGSTVPGALSGLRPVAAFGPTLDLSLWRSSDERMQLDFRAPLRAVLGTETQAASLGWLLSPRLKLSWRDPHGLPGWDFGMQAGPVFASRRYTQYLYGVAARDGLSGRLGHLAAGGYAGSQAALTLAKQFPRFWAGAYLRYGNLSGASFADGPLSRRQSTLAGGIAAAWSFGATSTPVATQD